ncbi:triose-phosphate isomerase [Candidatus Nitrospira allomarina]|uniref:Triosephosphate isomerase n=1 Tax=Candidatus Nitrospira allomarina TaxID=3020900 RepID=A0AA96GG29_9BACT|nr:triose-phosphate isomerase [Candidatus Nitrospira allomarina]WNM59635.1 triose-phosphate isomerase [Candidatus Nitrospira allomarina]
MLRRFIVGNWKMHKTISQAESLVKDILQIYQPQASVELAIAPPFVSLPAVSRLLASTPIQLAAQNTCASDEGAFTGEISPPMLRDVGCHYVIIGHSERRHIFGETDQAINKKIHAAFHHDLLPILCVGERLEERQSNKTQAVIQQQLQTGLEGLESKDFARITIAYEPVWAIGTGQAATVDQAAEVHGHIRSFLARQWGIKPDQTTIIYGGSVTQDNAKSLFQSSQINGALVGKACLNSESFVKIAELASSN